MDDKKETFYASLVVQLKLSHYYQFMQSVSTNLTLQKIMKIVYQNNIENLVSYININFLIYNKLNSTSTVKLCIKG